MLPVLAYNHDTRTCARFARFCEIVGHFARVIDVEHLSNFKLATIARLLTDVASEFSHCQ